MKKAVIAAALVAAFAVQLSATVVCELLCVFGDEQPREYVAAAASKPPCHSGGGSDGELRIASTEAACEHVILETSVQTQRPSRDSQLTWVTASIELQPSVAPVVGVLRNISPPWLASAAAVPLRI